MMGRHSLACLAFCLAGCVSTSGEKQGPVNSALSQANQMARDGLLREAADSYQKIILKEPTNHMALRNLGIVLVKAGDYRGAIQAMEKSLSRFEDNFEANYYLAEAYRAEERYGDAIYRYQKALKIQPQDPKALKSLAWTYFKIRYYSEAYNHIKKLLEQTPKDEQAVIIMARTLLKLKREQDALAVLHKGEQFAAAASQPYFWSVEGEILYETGDVEGAANVYRKAIKAQPLLAGALLGLGRYFLEQKKPDDAIAHLEKAVRVRPRLLEGHFLLGKAYEASNPRKALRYFKHFVKEASKDPEFADYITDAKKRVASLATIKPEQNTPSN